MPRRIDTQYIVREFWDTGYEDSDAETLAAARKMKQKFAKQLAKRSGMTYQECLDNWFKIYRLDEIP